MNEFPRLLHDMMVTHMDDVNQAIAKNGQVSFEGSGTKSIIKVSFFDKPIFCESENVYLCALAIESGLYDINSYIALFRPSVDSSKYLILKTQNRDCIRGDEGDYSFFSYAAVIWARESNGEYPVGMPKKFLQFSKDYLTSDP